MPRFASGEPELPFAIVVPSSLTLLFVYYKSLRNPHSSPYISDAMLATPLTLPALQERRRYNYYYKHKNGISVGNALIERPFRRAGHTCVPSFTSLCALHTAYLKLTCLLFIVYS